MLLWSFSLYGSENEKETAATTAPLGGPFFFFIVNNREKTSGDIWKGPEQREKRNRLDMASSREAR